MSTNSQARLVDFNAAEDKPHVDEIRQELGRIVGSAVFRDSLRLTRFLAFVVEAALAGNSDKIKAYTIAVEALGRSASFDPQADSIVRVEAGRLRQALARYYAEAGGNDPLVIDVPRGAYVPIFRRRTFIPSAGPTTQGERDNFADAGTAAAIEARSDDHATLQPVFEWLMKLRRQIDAMAAEVEIAKTMLERSDRMPRRD